MNTENRELLYGDPMDLKPYENNPRDNSLTVNSVAGSITEFGFTAPILVDENKVILAGHTRREAALVLGLEAVPYIIIDDLTEAQKKAYRLADNKLGELSVWDEEALKKELEDLLDEDIDLDVTGFTEVDLTGLLTEFEDVEEEPEKRNTEVKTTLPMLRFGSNSVRITPDELIILSNRYNEYVEAEPGEGFVTWLLKRGL